MQLRVLGPIEASADGRSLNLGGAKQRAVLAMLCLEANQVVSADRLIDGLWGERPPASATKMVQNYVWHLRGILGAGNGAEIVTRGRGYELHVDDDAVDVRRFERLMTEALRARHDAAPAGAAREALALWRGAPLADVADEPFAAAEIRRLEEARLEAVELVVDADLAAGDHLKVAGEIEALIEAHPLRERLHAQRMLALYRCGRQAEALEAYREARRTLVEEIGVEPGPELRRLQASILRQDPSLEIDLSVRALPNELDTAGAPPLVGRAGELAALIAGWTRARRNRGTLLTLVGEHGTGKTRLVAELAAEAHRDGAAVLYAAGAGAPAAALAAMDGARERADPTLLVIDDADRADAELREAIAGLAAELGDLPVLVVGTGQEAAALARLGPDATVALPPLGAEAVREIALLYTPFGSETEIPVDELLAESRGVAKLVHTAASRWARHEAARRVDAMADRAAAGRAHARALEAELVGGVVALQSTQERAERLTARNGGDVACPFKGLAGFEVADAQYFFGREQLVAELVARLAGAPLLAIVGPSGSGKSSVLRAGLLPALAGGVLPGSEAWAQVLIRPGERPSHELQRATASLGAERRVLAVDQFEEAFTTCGDERQRDAFVAALVRSAHEGRAVVVLAMRADFYVRCAAYPELARLLGANHVLVPSMTRDELRRAITRPAERVGLQVDPDLEAAIVGDLDGQPGALPLLSTALLELWSRREGRLLQLAAYSRSGGVHGAVARLAEAAFRRLDPSQQDVARTLLLRLADEAEDGAIVRRRVALADLDDSTAPVLDVLTDRRLLTVSAGTVEVAHEALLREWPRLRAWLEEDAEGRRLHRRLDRAAHDWARGGRDRGELYRGAQLALVLEWRGEHAPELNAVEQEFIDASRAANERARRRARLAFGGVLALLALTAIAALLALDGRDRARAQAQAAEAQRLGVQALGEPALDRSLLLARQGVALDDTPATRDNLLAALRRSPAAIAVMRGDGDALTAVVLQPDGRTIAVADSNGTIAFLDTRSGRRLGPLHQSAAISTINSLAYSPDGAHFASAGSDANGGLIELFDGRSHRSVRQLNANDAPWETFTSVTFSPDSHVLAAQTIPDDDDPNPEPNRLVRWDARTGRQLGYARPMPGRSATLLGYLTPARLVTFSMQDHATVIRDGVSLRALRSYAVAAPVAAMSRSARLVAFGSRDGSVRLLDLVSGRLRTAAGRHEGPVTAMAFSPDGSRLVSTGRDERLIVWDPRRAAAIEPLQARGRGLPAEVAIARDGRTAYSALGDGTLVAWDLDGARRLDRPLDGAGRPIAPRSLAVAADGSQFAMSETGGSIDIYDSRTLRLTSRIATRSGPGRAALAPDGRTLAAVTATGELGFWDATTSQPVGALQSAHSHVAAALAFSRDGRWLATGGGGNILRVWDARLREPMDTLPRRVADLSFGTDDATVAVTLVEENFSGGLEILSVPKLEVIRTVRAPAGTLGRFSRDGESFIYGDRQGRLWIFDPHTWKPRGRPLPVHGPLVGADLSPDGRLLVTTSVDGTARLWNATTGRAIGGPLTDASGDILGAGFIDDGARIVIAHTHGGYTWDVRPSSWERHACVVAGRKLTHEEWERALPERDYAPAC